MINKKNQDKQEKRLNYQDLDPDTLVAIIISSSEHLKFAQPPLPYKGFPESSYGENMHLAWLELESNIGTVQGLDLLIWHYVRKLKLSPETSEKLEAKMDEILFLKRKILMEMTKLGWATHGGGPT